LNGGDDTPIASGWKALQETRGSCPAPGAADDTVDSNAFAPR
jgi:hypothetical protein